MKKILAFMMLAVLVNPVFAQEQQATELNTASEQGTEGNGEQVRSRVQKRARIQARVQERTQSRKQARTQESSSTGE